MVTFLLLGFFTHVVDFVFVYAIQFNICTLLIKLDAISYTNAPFILKKVYQKHNSHHAHRLQLFLHNH